MSHRGATRCRCDGQLRQRSVPHELYVSREPPRASLRRNLRMEVPMKQLIVLASLLSASAAYADTSTYYWVGRGEWTDAKLQAAAQVCDQRFGQVMNGAIPSARYKRCMLSQGWRYQGTARVR